MPGRDLILLSLDGGGVRGLSSLKILKQLMERVAVTAGLDVPPKPCDYFDMIGGTSTGGIIAIMLGRLKMSIDDCIETYADLFDRVFRKKRHRIGLRGNLQGRFDTQELEQAIKDAIVKCGLPEDELFKDLPGAPCKVFVCAMNQRTCETVCLSSYQRVRGGSDRLRSVKIWEAARATSAATTFFDSITINMGSYSESFVDPAPGSNNPVRQVWNEAKDAWEPEPLEQNLKCLVSIGTGVPSIEPFRDDALGIGPTLVSISTETERTAELFQREHSKLDEDDRYFRLNVRNGLENIGLEKSTQKDAIMTLTERYLQSQETFKLLKKCGNCLAERETSLTYARPKSMQPHTAVVLRDTGPVERHVGSGKTTIATAVVETVTDESCRAGDAVIFYYCERYQTEKRQAFGLLASLIKQSLIRLKYDKKPYPKYLSTKLKDIYEYGRSEPDFEDLVGIFIDLFRTLQRPTIIIDGLDEMEYGEMIKVLDVFRQLYRTPSEQRLFISSREQLHHNIIMSNLVPNLEHLRISHLDNHDDICVYVETKIAEKMIHARQLTDNRNLIQQIKQKLQSGSHGMFLWVYLQIEALWDDCFTNERIRDALQNLPKDLDSTYIRCLKRIEKSGNMDHALKVFKWVSCTSRPLRIEELKEALAFTLEDTTWVADKIQSSDSVINRCGNLVAQDFVDLCVRFIHPSVQQYLQNVDRANPFHIDQTKGQLECGEFSIRYLNFTDFSSQALKLETISFYPNVPGQVVTSTSSGLGKFLFDVIGWRRYQTNRPFTSLVPAKKLPAQDATKYKFLSYATESWLIDTKLITPYSPVLQEFKSLALNPKGAWVTYPWLSGGQSYTSYLHGLLGWAVKAEHLSLLRIVVGLGPEYRVREFCNLPLVEDGLPALHTASKLGNEGVVRLLLEVCKLNELDQQKRNPLHYASEKGHITVTKILIENNADLNARSGDGQTPLDLAVASGHELTTEVLLQADPKLDAKGWELLLARAAESGHPSVLGRILEHASFLASEHGRLPANFGRMLLSLAAKSGHDELIRILLQHPHVVEDNKMGKRRTPLSYAAEHGHESTVRLLIEISSVDFNYPDSAGRTPLSYAAEEGHERIAQLLLEHQRKMGDFSDVWHRTPLSYAAEKGHEKVVRLLLKCPDVDKNFPDPFGRTPLALALANRHSKVARILSYEPPRVENQGTTASSAASS